MATTMSGWGGLPAISVRGGGEDKGLEGEQQSKGENAGGIDMPGEGKRASRES